MKTVLALACAPFLVLAACASGMADDGDETATSPSGITTSTSPPIVYMNDYFPTRNNTRLWRFSLDGAYAGQIFLKQVTEDRDPLFEQYGSAAVADRPGSTHYVFHDYRTAVLDPSSSTPSAYNASDAVYYADSWHMRNSPDGEVAEVTDVLLGTDAAGHTPICTTPSCPHLDYYAYDRAFIGHGRPGGHKIGESPFGQYPITYSTWEGGNLSMSPRYVTDASFISYVWLSNYLPTYTAPQGSEGGGFRKGGGRTYPGVVEVYFMMGMKVSGTDEHHCRNQPTSLPHNPGYNVYWQRGLLAPGIGWIEFDILFDEGAMGYGSCQGQLATGKLDAAGNVTAGGIDPSEANKWVIYIDDPRPEKDVDTISYTSCDDVGLAGKTGYFTSIAHATYDAKTGGYTYVWDRNNHCL